MDKAPYHKVKFQDQQLDDYILENSVLKSKLQSKIDALSIMSKELDKCNMERDRYKVLVEQLKCKNIIPNKRQDNDNSIYRFTPTNTISCSDILAKTRDHNNMLKLEVEMLRSNLEEATRDIIVLRNQLQKKKSYELSSENKNLSNKFTYSNKDYEQLVQDLEKIKKKYQQMQLDYRSTLDEKEELVSDREYYKSKVQRLNHQITYILTNRRKVIQIDNNNDPPKPIVDIDALVTENKYLHERINQLQIEKEIIKRTLSKYKALLDNRNKNYPTQFKKGFSDVMTQKQVRDFLGNNMKMGSKQSSVMELKSLSLGLLEALNDKSLALQHQRKTNQILANRITELERTLESWCNGEKYIPTFPSQMLIDEFLPDSGCSKSEGLKEKESNESQETAMIDNKRYKDESSDEVSSENDYVNENKKESKIILPQELEELVKEALAELKIGE